MHRSKNAFFKTVFFQPQSQKQKQCQTHPKNVSTTEDIAAKYRFTRIEDVQVHPFPSISNLKSLPHSYLPPAATLLPTHKHSHTHNQLHAFLHFHYRSNSRTTAFDVPSLPGLRFFGWQRNLTNTEVAETIEVKSLIKAVLHYYAYFLSQHHDPSPRSFWLYEFSRLCFVGLGCCVDGCLIVEFVRLFCFVGLLWVFSFGQWQQR